MGCGTGACGGDDKNAPKSPTKAGHHGEPPSSSPAKMPVGPEFVEKELYNNRREAMSDQMRKSVELWQKICAYSTEEGRAVDSETGLYNYAAAEQKKFLELVRAGAPPEFRWLAWKVALHTRESVIPGKYAELLAAKDKATWLGSIKADTCRTFTGQFVTERPADKGELEKRLENVLVAVSIYRPEIGYCQGLNYIGAFMLLVSGMKEEEVFWAFVSLLKGKLPNDPLHLGCIEGIYADKFPMMKHLLKVFHAILAANMPELESHLDKIMFPDLLWVHKWIFVFFLLTLPFGYCIRFWDYIMSGGVGSIFPLALALLQHFEKQLLGKDFAECNELLGEELKGGAGLPGVEELIERADKVQINWDALPKPEEVAASPKQSEGKKAGDEAGAINPSDVHLSSKAPANSQ